MDAILSTLSGRQADAGVEADALQDVGQEEVLRVKGNVQQEPGGRSSKQHPEIPESATPLVVSKAMTAMLMHPAACLKVPNLAKKSALSDCLQFKYMARLDALPFSEHNRG